ncbi:MAG: tetraacyldisaccharide 4'-kinase [Planctomycetota bacterium]
MTTDGPLPALLRPLAGLAEGFYRRGLAKRNARFDAGKSTVTLDRPVISIGNLSVGGTGKTPMTQHIVRALQAAGHRPAIAMRGYKPGPDGFSDEQHLHADELRGVPVVARPDRVQGLIQLFGSEEGLKIDSVVLDDGFQHRRLARHLDLVLIDASTDPRTDRLLPAGWLREPLESAARASAIILTHADARDQQGLEVFARDLERSTGVAVIATTHHAWAHLELFRNGEDSQAPVSTLAGRRVLAVCAIGRPERFLDRLVKDCRANVVDAMIRRDHDRYPPSAIAQIEHLAGHYRPDFVVTTAKDWVKLSRAGIRWPCPVARPALRIAFDSGETRLTELVKDAARLDPDDEPIRVPA